ncbi:MAG: ribosomal-protein-alanine N-acetyltransferase [Acidimicrobiaceae bacterium]|nr:ribosomal-protein-alanine N-acetyltransferase [Acidimicrobiaceae bacterium]
MSVVTAGDPVVLRQMGEADVHAVTAIDEMVFVRPWSTGFLRDQVLGTDTRFHVVAEAGGEVVGHAGLAVVADEGHVTTVAVHPTAQGTGIGCLLLAELCRRSVSLDLVAMTLEVRASNVPARGLYARFGFAPSGVRPGYYSDNDEDALVMWVHDIDDPSFMERVEAACVARQVPGGGGDHV